MISLLVGKSGGSCGHAGCEARRRVGPTRVGRRPAHRQAASGRKAAAARLGLARHAGQRPGVDRGSVPDVYRVRCRESLGNGQRFAASLPRRQRFRCRGGPARGGPDLSALLRHRVAACNSRRHARPSRTQWNAGSDRSARRRCSAARATTRAIWRSKSGPTHGHNEVAKPIAWAATAESILDKVERSSTPISEAAHSVPRLNPEVPLDARLRRADGRTHPAPSSGSDSPSPQPLLHRLLSVLSTRLDTCLRPPNASAT